MENDITKPKYFNCIEVVVTKVVLETREITKTKFVDRIRFETDLGSITYKPRRKVKETKVIDGFESEEIKSEMFSTSEIRTEFELIVKLNSECQKEPQKIWVSYSEIGRFDERENEEIFYKYFLENQFKNIWYEKFHGKNKELLERQQKIKEKFSRSDEDI